MRSFMSELNKSFHDRTSLVLMKVATKVLADCLFLEYLLFCMF